MAHRVYGSTMIFAELLDQGAWALIRSQQIRGESVRLRDEARELVLTFRSHRLRVVSGASDPAGKAETRTEDRSLQLGQWLRALASLGTVKTYVGLSRGATCNVCHKNIAEGQMEYELVADVLEVRLDADCYRLLREESARN